MARLIDADALNKELQQRVGSPTDDKLYEANLVIIEAPTIDAIPVEWLEKRRENLILTAMVHSTVYGDNSVELCRAVNIVLDMWQKEQEKR